MTIPTVSVTVTIFDTDDAPLAGAAVKAKITASDLYQDQIVERNEVVLTTDVNGRCVFQIFPNLLGERVDQLGRHTAYVFRAYHPTSGLKIYQTTAYVPNNNCNLSDIAGNVGPQEAAPIVVAAGIVVKRSDGNYAVRVMRTGPGISVVNDNGDAGDMVFTLTGDVAAIEALIGAGFAARLADNTWALRTIAPGANIGVTNGDGVAGNPTVAVTGIGTTIQAWDADLDALAGLATTGHVVRTGAGTVVTRSVVAGANISIGNGDGVAGNTTVSLTGIGATIQAWDADLDALAALAATGIIVRTGAGTVSARSITAGANISIGNGDGVAGNISVAVTGIGATIQAWDADLDALAALAANGMIARTGAGTVSARTITGTANQVSVGNGDGVAGNPTLSLPQNIDTAAAVTFGKVNKVTITAPATGATLTIAEGKTLTASNSITLSGTDGKTLTVSNSLTLAGTDATVQTFPAETASIGFRGLPQQSKSANYTTVLGDAGKHVYHPSTDANPRTFTIDSNANVAYDIGTTITFVNEVNTVTIAITSDTLTLMGAGTTGSRTLAANGIATALKVAATKWVISGTGLT